jgi:hypothetical protein
MGDEHAASAAAEAARVLGAGRHEYGWFGGRANDLDDRHSVAFVIADATATGDRLTFRFAYKSAVVSGVCYGRSFVGLWRQSTGDGEIALEFTADFESAEGWWTWPHEPARHRAFIRVRTSGDGA